GRIGHAEVVADRGAADVQTEPAALTFETGQIVRRRLRKVVGGRLDGIELHLRGQVGHVEQRHGRLRLDLEVEILAVAVAGDAQANARLAVALDRLDGWRPAGESCTGPGGQRGLQKLSAGGGHRELPGRAGNVGDSLREGDRLAGRVGHILFSGLPATHNKKTRPDADSESGRSSKSRGLATCRSRSSPAWYCSWDPPCLAN